MSIMSTNQSVVVNSQAPVTAYNSPLNLDQAAENRQGNIEFAKENNNFTSTVLPSLRQRHVSDGVESFSNMNSKRNFQAMQSEVAGVKHMKRPSQNFVVGVDKKKMQQPFPVNKKLQHNSSNRAQASELLVHCRTVD